MKEKFKNENTLLVSVLLKFNYTKKKEDKLIDRLGKKYV